MQLAHQLWPAQNPEKAKLVFLHGMGGTGLLWRPIAASLESDCSILAPDQRGHGKSQIATTSGGRNPPHYTPLDYGRDVIETLDATAFHPAWLIGHSMGVRTACATAHLRPDWIRGLVLIDLGFHGPAGGGLGEGLARFLENFPMHFASREAAREYMNQHSPDPSIGQYLLAVSAKTTDGSITFPFDRVALIQTIYAARDVSVRSWVKELGERKTPILVLRGAESRVWSREEFEAERTQFSAYSSIRFMEVHRAGHGLPFEQRLEFLRLLRQFIDIV